MKSLLRWFSGWSLTVKIVTLFLWLLLCALLMVTMLFRAQAEHQRRAELDSVARQNTELIARSIDAMIDNASYTSKMLLSSGTLQSTLIGMESFSSPQVLRKITMLLESVSGMQPYVGALYVFDTHGERIGVDNYSQQRFSFARVEDAPWYGQVRALAGYYLLLLNAGERHPLYGGENVISLVRSVYNLNEQSQLLGTVMLNLRESFITSCFPRAEGQGGALATVVDERGQPLLSSGQAFFLQLDPASRAALSEGGGTRSLFASGASAMLYCSSPTRKAPWRVVTALPLSGASMRDTLSTLWGTGLIIALFVLAATLITVRMVTRPLHLLGAKMTAPGGQPRRVSMRTARDEIGQLKDTYNDMVARIEALILRIQAEGERMRQAELYALQAQINPHFLYNTIDTARAMALSGDARGLNLLLRSLGEFYRNSISNGRAVITLGEELTMVRSYLAIQRIRYQDIDAAFSVDEAVNAIPIPKLVLQPLVENAIYHGLRQAGNRGRITVRASMRADGAAVLSVEDDGVGISEMAVRHALGEGDPDASGFGLRGTVDRLRLYYGARHTVSIENVDGHGTRVTITIEREEGGAGAEGDGC